MRPPLALALAALLPACAEPVVGPSIPGGGVIPIEPTLSSISANVFVPRCSSSACHAGTGSAPLDLTEAAAFTALVNAPAAQTEEMPLVSPLEPDRSYLMLKLLGTFASTGSGGVMPPDGELLGDDALQAIQDWILNGAPND
jgi:hypothetical protein